MVVPFAATLPGQRLGGADLHTLRSQETATTTRVADRELSILGCHSADSGDFAVAVERLADSGFPKVEFLVSFRTRLEELPGLLSSDDPGARHLGKVVVEI